MLQNMAVESNGRLAEPGKKGINGHAIAPKTKASKKKGSFSLVSMISRILTWYSIITILFRCPTTPDLITDISPKICKPYFQLREVVAPHIEPYYNAYAAQYVDAARPYYKTLDQRIITPATILGKKYGAPRVAQAQAYGQAQWEKSVQPQVLKYQGIVKAKYDETVGPHIDKAIATASPYYDTAKTNALQTYYGHVLPTYNAARPYAIQGYEILSNFAVDTAIPYSKWAWETGSVFIERTVWPQIRILYGENVEPQLMRIGQRLGRYRDGKKLKAAVDKVESTYASTTASSTAAATTQSIAFTQSTEQPTDIPDVEVTATSTSTSEVPEVTPESEKEIREKAEQIVANDLRTWQEKFAKAADEGSDDLEERISEITNKLIETQVRGVGDNLIIQLEETVKSRMKALKSDIKSVVENSKDSEEPEEELTAAVRKAGIAIKDKAQAVRTWRQNFDAETNSLVSQSASDTFEILDYIRDLGLQEIGMRWAWTDGITHRDWAKYHKLKTKFDEWRVDVELVVTEHEGLGKARAASEEVESKAMDIAEQAAKELSRIKETGRWKLSAGDSSDDFSTKHMPAAAAVAGQKIIQKADDIKNAVSPSSQDTVESVASVASSFLAEAASPVSSIAASVADSAQSAVFSVSESIVGTSQGGVESVLSVANSGGRSLAGEASNSVIGTSQGIAESVMSVASESVSSITEQTSSSVSGTPQGTIESTVSSATEKASDLSVQDSSSTVREEPGVVGKASDSVKSAATVVSDSISSISDAVSSLLSSGSSQASSVLSDASSSLSSVTSSIASSLSESISTASSSVEPAASSASSTASKKVWGGAMAQSVEARQIIFDDIIDESDDDTFSQKIQIMASEAGERYADITKAVSEALLQSSTTTGYQLPTLAAQKYSSALAAASSALYGSEQGTGENIVNIASSRYNDAVSAASVIIYGTPAPITSSIASQASKAYLNALSRASENYAHARSLVSAQISGEPRPVHEQMFSSVEAAYSDSLAAASSRLQAAASAAATAVYGAPPNALESLSSMAQVKLAEGLDAASSRFQEGKKYLAAMNTGTPQKQKMFLQMQEQYYAGIGMAHARYSEFIDAASSAVMPKTTPLHEYAHNKAGVKIAGSSTHGFEAALSNAASHYSYATAEAASELNKLLASVKNIGGEHKSLVPTSSLAAMASSRYSAAVAEASNSYSSIASVIAAVYGSETPMTEAIASAASENWEALVTKASEQIYGATTPYFVTRRLISEAKEYGAQVTEAASSQYMIVQSIISELVVGKEPDFTDSVYNKLSSAYYTGAGAAIFSASSYANEVYQSASSVVDSVFTPPPAIEVILSSASSRVNDAVEAASIQFYGTKAGNFEKASSSASSVYSSAQSVISEKIHSSTPGYAEAASSSIADAAASAQKAISEAIYGTPTGTVEAATGMIGDTYASATSAAGEAYSAVQTKISEAMYSPEQGTVESAQLRLSAAVESARARLSEFAATAGEGASEFVKQASEGVEEFASSVSSAVGSAAPSVKDEL
ncbi:hypothetical protein BGZ60DRAFT_504966 [Tricladium varicosporioides]|nr:hypothetical protein BGZ60DRAFT_504966 [Hymenoscyphus varicosporioides]